MSYRPDYTPRDKPLRKWDQIGELVTRAIQSERLYRRVRLVFEILALLNENEEKAIGIEKQWKDKWLRGAYRRIEDFGRDMEWYEWNRRLAELWRSSDYGVDENGRRLTEGEWLRNWNNEIFDIREFCGKILRLVCEYCESKGVRIGHGVEAEGPRGHIIGVSRIVGERVEVETRKDVDEESKSESAETETLEKETEQ